jgi:hypothetical protein
LKIFILGRRLYRLLLIVLILILVLPLLHYFFISASNPAGVQFKEPLGDAIKVLLPEGAEEGKTSVLSRVIYYIREFYQNKL